MTWIFRVMHLILPKKGYRRFVELFLSRVPDVAIEVRPATDKNFTVPQTIPFDVLEGEVGIEPGTEWIALGSYEIFGAAGSLQIVRFRGAIALYFPTGIGLAVHPDASLDEVETWLHDVVWPRFRAREEAGRRHD